MDLVSLGFLLLILVVSGFIAYQADKLGKRLGKKRLSVFGLRPRHVAALGTVLLGVTVSFLTILFVAAVSKDARTWLYEGRGLLIERERLRKEVQDLRKEQTDEEARSRELQAEVGEREQKLQEQTRKYANLAKKNGELDRRVREQNQQVKTVELRLAMVNRKLSTAERELTQSQVELSAKLNDLKSTQISLKAAELRLSKSQASLIIAEKNTNVAIANSNAAYKQSLALDNKNRELEKDIERQSNEVARLQADLTSLTKQREDAEAKVQEKAAELEAKQRQYDEVAKNYVQLQQVSLALESTFTASRIERPTYLVGEEVARISVPAATSTADAQTLLTSLLRLSRVEAENRGAKSHRNAGKFYDIADIFDRKDEQSGAMVSADVLKRAVIARVAGRLEDQVLIATSSLNAFRGESVSLEIGVLNNPLVYRRGDVVTEARIDGSKSDRDVIDQLSDFFSRRVSQQAANVKMIPRAGAAAPYGEVPVEDMLALLREVKRAGRTVRVIALAATDTRAADPLRLEFRIK